jgi:hypothetical protein
MTTTAHISQILLDTITHISADLCGWAHALALSVSERPRVSRAVSFPRHARPMTSATGVTAEECPHATRNRNRPAAMLRDVVR